MRFDYQKNAGFRRAGEAVKRRSIPDYSVLKEGFCKPIVIVEAFMQYIRASRRTNPNNPAFYKPVRKGLVRRLA